MSSLHLILMVFALVCAILAAVGVPTSRYNMIGASLAFYFAAIIFAG